MTNEDIRLAYQLIRENECWRCSTPYEVQRIKWEGSDEDKLDLCSDYDCAECSSKQRIEVQITNNQISAKVYDESVSRDADVPDWVALYTEDRSALYQRAHPARDLVDAINQLDESVGLLRLNKERVMECYNKLQGTPFKEISNLEMEPGLEIHNYLSCSYTFSQILETIKPDLPTDGPVDTAMKKHDEEFRVISGLRIYIQHHLLPELKFLRYYNNDIGEERYSFVFDRNEVWVNESGLDKYEESNGYKHGSEHHYGHISQDDIDIPWRIERHYNSVDNLEKEIAEYAVQEYKDQLEDYSQKSRLF